MGRVPRAADSQLSSVFRMAGQTGVRGTWEGAAASFLMPKDLVYSEVLVMGDWREGEMNTNFLILV